MMAGNELRTDLPLVEDISKNTYSTLNKYTIATTAIFEVGPFFLISLEAHQTYSVNLKTIGSQDYRDLDAQ